MKNKEILEKAIKNMDSIEMRELAYKIYFEEREKRNENKSNN